MKFAMRELFLLILVVGLGLGWWLDRTRLSAQVAIGDRWREKAEDLANYCRRFEGWTIRWNDAPDGWDVDVTTPRGAHQAKADATGLETTSTTPALDGDE